jgi:hypothetical protein
LPFCLYCSVGPLSSRTTETPPIVDEIPSGDTIEYETFNIADDEVRVFRLAATLQVATVQRNFDTKFDMMSLADNQDDTPLAGQMKKGENLGVAIIDLGYCAMNKQGELCFESLDYVAALSAQLGVSSSFNAQTVAAISESSKAIRDKMVAH